MAASPRGVQVNCVPIVADVAPCPQGYVRTIRSSTDIPRLRCPHCGRLLQRRGRYQRWASERRRDVRLTVFRQYCPECGKCRGVLPAFLRPYARYVTLLRETVARARALCGDTLERAHARVSTEDGGVSRRTVQRWWAEIQARAPVARDALAEQLVRLSPAVNPVDVVAEGPIGDAVVALLHLGRAYRRQFWARMADRRAWAVGLFGLYNAQGWASLML